jgi:hypothetical protein
MMLMTKKLNERPKMTKNDPQKNPIRKRPKRSPARAARNRGAEESQGEFMARSREAELTMV